MAGERKGKVYEALVYAALEELKGTGQLKGKVFWNQKPEAMTIEPDLTIGKDPEAPETVLLVTHSGSAKNSDMKLWRNMGELAEAKIRLPGPPRVYSVAFDSVIKEDLKKLQAVAFDGQLIVGDEPYGPALQQWVDSNLKRLPSDGEERVEAIREAAGPGGGPAEFKKAFARLTVDLGRLLSQKRAEIAPLWAAERKRPAGRKPDARETFVRRGLSKLLVFEDLGLAIRMCVGDVPSASVPEYAFRLGLARKSLRGARISDDQILNAVRTVGAAEALRILGRAPVDGMSGWLTSLRNSSHVALIGSYVRENLPELLKPSVLKKRLHELHRNPEALVNGHKESAAWPPADVWLLEYLIDLVKAATGSANGYGYAQLGREVVAAGFTRREHGNPRLWVGGFILSDWVHRRGAEELDDEALTGIATVLATRLRAIPSATLAGLFEALPALQARHIVEAKLVTYKEFDPLFLLIQGALPAITKRKCRTCFAEASGLGGQGGLTTVAFLSATLVTWRSATDEGKDHKKKELCGRAAALRYSWDEGSRRFVLRPGVKKLILVVDGTWTDGDLEALSRAGWDEIFYPDEMDQLAKAII